jgi:ketosteroid isomerase-like protein
MASITSATLATQDVRASRDYAHEIGAATLQVQLEGGVASTEQVKHLVVWKRQPGGAWWPHLDIWNTNAERDDAILAHRPRPTSGSYSR